MQIFVLTVEHVLMFARLRLFILSSISFKKLKAVPENTAFFIKLTFLKRLI